MLIRLHRDNPNPRDLNKIVKSLKNGGIIIYPTDTGYSMGCDLHNKKAVEKIILLRQLKKKKKNLSFICSDLKHIAEHAEIGNDAYKIMKRIFPGPFAVILKATKVVSKIVSSDKKTVGIRIPENNICQALIRELGNPIISTSINHGDEDVLADPEDIFLKFHKSVDYIIDDGYIYPEYSTVLDLTEDEVEIIREGKGDVSWLT